MSKRPKAVRKNEDKPRGSAALNERRAESLYELPLVQKPLSSAARPPLDKKPSEVIGRTNADRKKASAPLERDSLNRKLPVRETAAGRTSSGSIRQGKAFVKPDGMRNFRGASNPPRRGNIIRRTLNAISGVFVMIAAVPLWSGMAAVLRRGRAGRILLLGLASVLIVGVLSALVYFMTRSNAYSITVDSEQVAIIRMTNEDVSEELKKQAVLRIENRLGTRILINEQIEFLPMRASAADFQPIDEAIIRISEMLTYRVEAVAISVMGTRMAVVRNQEEADRIFNHLKEPHLVSGANFVEVGFVENVTTDAIYTEEESLDDLDIALRILTTPIESAQDYIVVPGDSLGIIASRANMSLNELMLINPNIDTGRHIRPGDVIHLMVERPQISVRTVEERSRTIEIEPPVEHIYNPQQRSPNRRTVQIGTFGSANIVEHVIRINSSEFERVEVERIVTLEPQAEIIEIGTG